MPTELQEPPLDLILAAMEDLVASGDAVKACARAAQSVWTIGEDTAAAVILERVAARAEAVRDLALDLMARLDCPDDPPKPEDAPDGRN